MNKIEEYSDKTLSPTLTARMGTGGNQVPILHGNTDEWEGVTDISERKTIRRLTPLECERLQGLEDNYTNVPFNNKPVSDARRYKAIGNGMAQPCADYILECIVRGFKKENKEV